MRPTTTTWLRFAIRALQALGNLFMLLVLAAPALAGHGDPGDEVVVFGPRTYQRGSGAADVIRENLSLPSGVAGPWLLRMQNGSRENGRWRNGVGAGSLHIDGIQVLGNNDFNRDDQPVEKSVQLTPHSRFELRLAGKAGGRVTLTLIGHRPRTVPVAFDPQRLRLTTGATGQMSVQLAPPPTVPGMLALRADERSVVRIPSTVAFAAGQQRVTFDVEARANGHTDIVASLNGRSVEAAVTVARPVIAISELKPATLELARGSNGALTVVLSAAPSRSVDVTLESSNRRVVSLPGRVRIPAGRTSAEVAVAAIAPGVAHVHARLEDGHRTSRAIARIRVVAALPAVVSLLPVTSAMTLGAQTQLQLNLSAAQVSATTVPLAASPDGILTLPAQVVVPAGQTGVAFPVTAVALGTAGITAALNGSTASAAVQVLPPAPQVTAFAPPSLTLRSDAIASLRATLNAVQMTATELTVTAADPRIVKVPPTATVPAGQGSIDIPVTGLATGTTSVSVQAGDSAPQAAAVTVIPQAPAPVSLLPNPLPIQQGASGQLTLTLNAAQLDDTTLAVSNSAPAVVQAPTEAVVPAGNTSAAVTLSGLAPGNAIITATLDGNAVSADVVVAPPPPVASALDPAALSLPKGAAGRLAVTLSRTSASEAVVALSSSDPLVAEVPATLTVPAGALTAETAVLARGEGVADITASLNGGQVTSRVTVTPPELVSLALSPQAPLAYVGESVAFMASGTYTDASIQDVTTKAAWSSDNPTIATIASTGFMTAAAPGAVSIQAVLGSIAGSTPVTVQNMPFLSFSPASASLKTGEALTLAVTSSVPADTGGLTVALAVSGVGSVNAPASITIPGGQTTATFTITGQLVGDALLTASGQRRVPANLPLRVLPKISITSLNPSSGPVGTPVTIVGTSFDASPAANDVRFNGERAVVAAATATTLNVIVPVRATSGNVTVTTAQGTATSPQPFAVQGQHDFDISLAPDAVQAPAGGFAAVRVQLQSKGLAPYAYAANVSLSNLPSGVTAKLERPTVYVGGETTAILTVPANLPAGSYSATVTATGQTETGPLTRTKTVTLDVVAGATSVTGRVLHAEDDSPFVGARVRLGTQAVTTDASGYYRFINPTLSGDQVLLIDGHVANTPTAEYPGAIAMPVMIQAGLDNVPLVSYIQAIDPTKYQAIVPGSKTDVVMPDLPNYALNIPQGAVLTGWDGTPITKVNVRTVPADRLPIKPLPAGVNAKTVYLYYFFREGGANPSTPIPVTMANDMGALPGEKADLWYYDESTSPDPNSNQWRIMGQGTVTADGKSIVSDPGVGIPKFCCGASTASPPPPPDPPDTCPKGPASSNPVVYGTGAATVYDDHSLGLNGRFPVKLGCAVNTLTERAGPFGPGTWLNTEWQLSTSGDTIVLMSPAGHRWLLGKGADGVYRTLPGRNGAYGAEASLQSGKTVVRFPDGTLYEFASFGRGNLSVVAQQDPRGNRTTLTRAANGLLQSVTDAQGRVWRLEYNSANAITRITDPLGRSLGFTYGPSIPDITGNVTVQLTQVTDAAGNLTRYDTVDTIRTVGQTINPVTQIVSPVLEFIRTVKKTRPTGEVTQYEFDRITHRTRTETFADGATYTFDYTALNVLSNIVLGTKVTDPRGNVTNYRFNGQGDWTRQEDPLGRISSRKLDNSTNLVQYETDPAGRIKRYTYDANGNVTSIRDALDNPTLIEYGPINNKPTAVTDALGNKRRFSYDTRGNLTSAIDAMNAETRYEWTAQGDLAAVVDPLGNRTVFASDAAGNIRQVTDALGNSTDLSYDIANRLTSISDPLGLTTQQNYDVLDRITDITDPEGGITRFTYDAKGRLLSAIDPRGNPVERNLYDARGRLSQKQDAAGLSTNLQYDLNSNLVSVTDRKGQTTTFAYDVLNRLISRNDPDGRSTTWDYDLAGNIAALRDNRSGDLLISYDALNRPTRIVSDQGTLEYQYDAIGRRTQRTINGGDATTYQYDKADRLTQLTYRGRTTRFEYDLAGRLTKKTLPNGLIQTYVWDAANRLASTALAKGTTTIETLAYDYDAAGRRTARSATVTDVPETAIEANYDNSNRLTTITIAGQPYAMSYDANGNLTKKTGTGQSNASDVTNYTWNSRNQLTGIQSPTVTASFKYDALGRRMEKTVNGDTVQYLYDGAQAIAEIRGSALSATYLTTLEIDDVIARYTSQGERSYLTDALGSVIVAAKEDGSVATAYGYSPYGETQVMGTDEGNPAQYTGRENDGTGLYYYRARYYDPQLKQWVSEDPIGIAGGLNVYSYVRSNPLVRRDPLGLFDDGINAGGYQRGHSDFSGNENFDYTREDREHSPWEYEYRWRHFRDLSDVERDLANDLCNKSEFELTMHQGQDYFSHYSKGYRRFIGHATPFAAMPPSPDSDRAAWNAAEDWTKAWVKKWNDAQCNCKK